MMNIYVVRVLSVLFLSLLTTGCDIFNKTAEEYLYASQSYYDQGEFTASLIEIKNAIQQAPRNSDIRQFAAKVYLKMGKGDDAAIQLTKAISLGADKNQLLSLQAQALFQQRKYRELLGLNVPDSLNEIELSNIYVYQGFAAAELKDTTVAGSLYQKSVELNPNNRLAYRGIALLYSSTREFEKALKVIQGLLEKQPQDAELWSLQGDIYVSSQDHDNAYISYTKAAKFEQGAIYPHIAKRALACISKDDVDCVVQDLTELENNVPGYYMTGYVKGLLAIKQKRWKDAELALSDALAINSELTPAYYFSGLSHFQQKQFGPAITKLSAFVARQPESTNGRHMLSLAQVKEGHLESAKMTLQPMINRGNSDSSIVYLLGHIEYLLGNISESIHNFKLLSERHPKSAVAHAQLGLKLLASGDTLSGQDELAIAIEIAPDLMEAGQASVLAFLDSKQFEKAQDLIDKMRTNTTNNAVLDNLQGVLYLQQGDLKQAKDYFYQALIHAPGDPTASHNLARLMLQQGDLQKGFQIYNNVLAKHPQHIPTHLKLAELELKQGNDIKAELRLMELIDIQPDALGPRIMLAEYYLLSGRVESVIEILQPVAKLYPNDQRLLKLKAESLLASGHFGQAKREAQILANLTPDSAEVQWLLARSAIADRDKFKGEHALKQTLLLDPEHVPAQIIQIKLLAENKKFTQANRVLQKLLNSDSGDSRVGSVAAWMALVTGDTNKAVKLYTRLYSSSATSSNALGLSNAQWKAGSREQAINTLEEWTFKNPDDVKAQFRLAMNYQHMGLDREASTRFGRVLQFQPNNVIALNNLAWLIRNENPAKALQYIEKASELEPDSAAVFDTLGVVLLLKGDTDRAQRILQRAARAHPDHPALHYHYALALHRNRQPVQAINVLEKLLATNFDFSDKLQAQMLLKKLKAASQVSS